MDVEILKTLPVLFATAAIPMKATATSTTQAQTARTALRLTLAYCIGIINSGVADVLGRAHLLSLTEHLVFVVDDFLAVNERVTGYKY